MDRISVARIGKTHGVKGFIKVVSFSGEYDHLFDLREAVAVSKQGKEKPLRIEEIRPFGGQVLIKFVGFDSPEDARVLSGCELLAENRFAAPLKSDEYYIKDLIGCSLYVEEKPVAKVLGVADTGHSDLLEVKTSEGAFRYVPLKKEYIGEVDTAAGRIELVADWILE